MSEWLAMLTWKKIIVGSLLVIVTFAVSSALVSLVLVKLPATYFHPSHNRNL